MRQSNLNLAKIANEAIRRQRKRVRELEQAGSSRDFNEAQKILAQLINQARALTKDGLRWAKSLTPEQTREVIAGWFEALPLQQQKQMLQELMQIHNGERAA